jgi:hypothetical protein
VFPRDCGVLSTWVLVVGQFCKIDEVSAKNCKTNICGNTLHELFAAVDSACGLFCTIWKASFAMQF